jgi:Flp pilus assembly protein TadG
MKKRRFATDASGMSAIDFGIVSPILALLVVGMIEGWSYATSVLEMRSAVHAAANYVVQGGSDENTIQTIAMTTWEHRPDDGTVTILRYCTCGGVVVTCAGLCPGTSKVPETFLDISASGTWQSAMQTSLFPASHDLEQQQVIRVR